MTKVYHMTLSPMATKGIHDSTPNNIILFTNLTFFTSILSESGMENHHTDSNIVAKSVSSSY